MMEERDEKREKERMQGGRKGNKRQKERETGELHIKLEKKDC